MDAAAVHRRSCDERKRAVEEATVGARPTLASQMNTASVLRDRQAISSVARTVTCRQLDVGGACRCRSDTRSGHATGSTTRWVFAA